MSHGENVAISLEGIAVNISVVVAVSRRSGVGVVKCMVEMYQYFAILVSSFDYEVLMESCFFFLFLFSS